MGKLHGMAKNIRIHSLSKRALALLTSALTLACALITTQTFAQQVTMKLRLHIDGEIVTATLNDSAAARDFAALLPLSLTLKEYAGVERISDLPGKLSVAGAPAGMAPRTGDITYYAPWGNLAIFVGDDVYARGLVRLGKVDAGLPALQRPGPMNVRIERIKD